MKKMILILILSILLSACGPQPIPPTKGGSFLTPTPLTTPLPSPVAGLETPASALIQAPDPVEAELFASDDLPDGEALRQLMLFSHTHWRKFWGDGWVVAYAGDGSTNPLQVTHTQLWLEQPVKARVLSGSQTMPQSLWVSDGIGFSLNNSPVQELPPSVSQTFNPPTILSDTVQPHPFAGMLGTPLSDMVFPTGLAQRGGEFQVIGKEELAGRTVFVALWSFQVGGPVVDRMWIDARTGMLLRWINYSKPGGSFISTEMYFSSIDVDQVVPELAFAVSSSLPPIYAADAQDVAAP